MDVWLILQCLHSVKGSDRQTDYLCPECKVRYPIINKVPPKYNIRCTECRFSRRDVGTLAEANRRSGAHWRRTNHEVTVSDEHDVTNS